VWNPFERGAKSKSKRAAAVLRPLILANGFVKF